MTRLDQQQENDIHRAVSQLLKMRSDVIKHRIDAQRIEYMLEEFSKAKTDPENALEHLSAAVEMGTSIPSNGDSDQT
jgi:hypothetical protein